MPRDGCNGLLCDVLSEETPDGCGSDYEMKIKIKDVCIVIIYILIFVSALANMRYTVTNVYSWRLLYIASIFAIIAFSVLYKVIKRRIVFGPLTILLHYIIIYELVVSYFSHLFVFPMIIVDILPWPMLISVFYDYSKNNELPSSFTSITLFGMLLVCAFSIPNLIARYRGNGNSAVFTTCYCLSFLPMVFLSKKREYIILFSSIVAVIMLLTIKRSAFIIILLGLLLYYVVSIRNEGESKKKIKRTVLFALAISAAVFFGQYIIERMNLSILLRLSRMIEDGGSGRLKIWRQVLLSFSDSSSVEKWFGHGFHSVFYEIKPLGIARYAHNSFLETLYDYGYIGLVMIVIVVFRIITDTVKMIRMKNEMAPIMAYSIVPMIVLGFVSYFFEQSVIILPLCVVWGTCMGSFFAQNKRMDEVKK